MHLHTKIVKIQLLYAITYRKHFKIRYGLCAGSNEAGGFRDSVQVCKCAGVQMIVLSGVILYNGVDDVGCDDTGVDDFESDAEQGAEKSGQSAFHGLLFGAAGE